MNPLSKITFFFGIFMVPVYILAGIWLMTTHIFDERFSSKTRLIMGFVIIAYGIFRAFRQYNVYKNEINKKDI